MTGIFWATDVKKVSVVKDGKIVSESNHFIVIVNHPWDRFTLEGVDLAPGVYSIVVSIYGIFDEDLTKQWRSLIFPRAVVSNRRTEGKLVSVDLEGEARNRFTDEEPDPRALLEEPNDRQDPLSQEG